MKLLVELRADAASAKLLPALFIGLAMGVVLVIGAVAISALIFSGTMAPLAARGAGLVLLGTLVLCLVISLTSGYRGVVSMPQDAPIAVSVSVVAAAGASMAGAAGETLFMTLAVILILTSAAAGACILLIGRVGAASVLRFVPYPVVGGYLAGSGWILALWALAIMSGVAPTWEMLPRFLESPTLWKWLPGVAYAVALRLALVRWNHFLVIPVSFVLAAVAYHIGLKLLDISHEEAAAAGLLFSGIAEHRLWPAFHPGELVHVDWSVVIRQTPNILIIVPVMLFSLTMDLKGIQASSGVELDLDREFRAAGMANMIAALGGGSPPGYHLVSYSLSSRMFGAYSRLTGLTAALFMAAVLLGGGSVLAWFPVPLMGGLTLFIAVDLLHNWLIASRLRRLSADYGVVFIVFLTVSVFGFLEGAIAGLAIAATLLAIRLARIDAIKTVYTARERRSSRKRPISHHPILQNNADRLRGYQLHGYIFFGSAHALVDRLKEPLQEDPPPLCILLDCTGVTGFDISALDALGGFVAAASSRGVQVVMVAPAERLRADLRRGLSDDVRDERLLLETDPDRALERGEDIVIAAQRSDIRPENGSGDTSLNRFAGDIESQLDRRILFEDMAHELREWLQVRDYEPGEALVAAGTPQDGLQLLVMGRASAYEADGSRLRQYGPGDAIEPRGAFEVHEATAATVADEACRTLVLTPAVRRWLEENRARLMQDLYGYLLTADTSATDPTGSRAPDAG